MIIFFFGLAREIAQGFQGRVLNGGITTVGFGLRFGGAGGTQGFVFIGGKVTTAWTTGFFIPTLADTLADFDLVDFDDLFDFTEI